MKTCVGCHEAKPEGQYYWKDRAHTIRQDYCRECKARYNRAWYQKHSERHRAGVSRNNLQYRQDRLAVIAPYKEQPCADCCHTFPPECMEFDHVHGEKLGDISTMVYTQVAIAVLIEEIAKCEVVCANCHRLRTTRRRSSGDRAQLS